MYGSLKELFEAYHHRPFDDKLFSDIKSFRLGWAQKEDQYIEFLGGNTLGTQTIRFSIKDDEGLIVDTLNIDMSSLNYDLSNTKGITKGRAAETNCIYQTLVYLMHGFSLSKLVNNKIREEAIKECYYIFAYKKFSSLMFNYFKFPADEAIAKVVYEKLSNKFLIKKLNNWQEVFEYRAKDVLNGGIHYGRIKEYSTEDAIRVILDLQTKLNDMFKNIYAITIQVYNSNERIGSDTLITTIEDNEELKSLTNNPDRYIKYVNSIIRSKADFVKYELVQLIAAQFNKLPAKTLYDFLLTVTEFNVKNIDLLVDVSIVGMIGYLSSKGIVKDYNKHIVEVLNISKQKYSNTKYDDKDTKQIKKILDKEFIKLNPKASYISSQIVSSVLMYTFIRCLYRE